MLGQGVYVQSSSEPPATTGIRPSSSSELAGLAICSSFTVPPPLPQPPPPQPPPSLRPGDLRRLGKHPHPTHVLKCPRCASLDTKFCYYNNYSLSQPRYFCKNCKRYWTAGGALRNVPVGGGLRKNKRSKLKLAAAAAAAAEAEVADARELAGHQQQQQERQYYSKAPSPVASSAGAATNGPILSTTMSNLVSGSPATLTATGVAATPSFNPCQNSCVDLLRVSSGSDNTTGTAAATYHHGDVTAAAASVIHHQQQNGHHAQSYYVEAHPHPPQFYSSFSTSLNPTRSHSHHQTYHGSSASPVSGTYQGPITCVNQYMQTPANSMQPSTSSVNALYPVISTNSCNGGVFSSTIKEGVKEEEQEVLATNSNYDWQIISDHLFNGTGSEGFLPLPPGGSWPEFSQFHDSSGSG